MIGIDVTIISRFERFLVRFGERGLERFLSPEEMNLAKSPKSIAGLWAAKEAAAKALGVGIGKELGFKNMVISKNERGAPFINFDEDSKGRFCIQSSHLSITHDGDIAIAVVLIKRVGDG